MSYYNLVRTALWLRRERGPYSTARFLRNQGVCLEERRKLLSLISK